MGQQRKSDSDPYATLEYRKAFKAYVQTGEPIPSELRAAGDSGTTVAEDIGAIIPTTLMNELIKKVSGVYGTLYSKVRKLNIRGGVAFPISAFGATFKWINDGTVSANYYKTTIAQNGITNEYTEKFNSSNQERDEACI